MFPALRSLTYFTFSSAYRRVSHATHAYRREPLTHPARLSLTPHLRTAHFRLAHAHVLIPHTPFFHFFFHDNIGSWQFDGFRESERFDWLMETPTH